MMKSIRPVIAIAVIVACLGGTNSANAGIDEAFLKPAADETWGNLLLRYFRTSEFRFDKSFAMVIGISKFEDFRDLPTEQDPIRIKDYLQKEAAFDYVHLLTEDRVTPERVRELMEDEFPRRVGPNDRFLFYWSGHGHTERDRFGRPIGYLPTARARLPNVSLMISMERLVEWDLRIRAKQVLYLLDSCFSGHAGSKPLSDVRNVTIEQMARPSRHIITAGTSSQETIATEKLQGSIFSRALLEGLRGAADTESTFLRDGLITVNELEDYLKKRVEVLRRAAGWGRPITPQLWDLGDNEGEFFFLSSTIKEQTIDERTNNIISTARPGYPMSQRGDPASNNDSIIEPSVRGLSPDELALLDRERRVNVSTSEYVEHIVLSSPFYRRGDTVRIIIDAHSSKVKASALFGSQEEGFEKRIAKYDRRKGGVYIEYRVPAHTRLGVHKATVFVQEIGSAKEEKHEVKYEIR